MPKNKRSFVCVYFISNIVFVSFLRGQKVSPSKIKVEKVSFEKILSQIFFKAWAILRLKLSLFHFLQNFKGFKAMDSQMHTAKAKLNMHLQIKRFFRVFCVCDKCVL